MRALLVALAAACGATPDARVVIQLSGSAVGTEGEVFRLQARAFEALHPSVRVEILPTPDAADQRHQLYVQWLNAGAATPDVLQLDVIWTAEMAAAGWLRPLDVDEGAFFAPVMAADTWQGRAYAVPLFVDAGMLYWRTDLFDHPPASYAELATMARAAPTRYGLVWAEARYEGLVCAFLEVLEGFGGSLDALAAPAAVRALDWMHGAFAFVPRAALAWQEEQTRFAFQSGDAAFMRNWPYAYPLVQRSGVAGRFAVAPMPAEPGGRHAATLGGAQLAINARSRHPDEARALIAFLTAPEQLVERARIAGQYPARPALYQRGLLDGLVPIPPADALRVLANATPRPVTPLYSEQSAALQVQLHRALSDQASAGEALAAAARDMAAIAAPPPPPGLAARLLVLAPLLGGAVALLVWLLRRRRAPPPSLEREDRLGLLLVAPATAVVALVAFFPVVWTVWESLHAHDLRMPWRGRPFVGVANYVAVARDGRFWAALAHTAVFTVVTVAMETLAGLALALLLHRIRRGRGLVRTVVLLPWAIPTVVAAMVWRFLFADAGAVNALVAAGGARGPTWLVDATLAWVPIVLADVWRTTPFVTLLLLAGLATIDDALYDAARADGASGWLEFRAITLPLLRPALLVALVFRTLDAFRVFDLIFVLTGGAPGTATEPIALYTFDVLRDLRFGMGATLATIIFGLALGLAALFARALRAAP